jgi:WD40 repeat protein
MKTGANVVGPLTGHASPVNSVAISHDGKFIVSGSDDMTIRV